MKRIAIVCQRYGLEVNGGAELLCRQFAEKLSASYDVEVFTTCAVDYMTWKNQYQDGIETLNGIKIIRFPVERQRNINKFNKLSEKIFFDPKHTLEQELEWIDEQGPYCPKLVEYILENRTQYQVILFMTYLYYLTAKCIAKGMENAILIPTAHDEPPIYLKYYQNVFINPKGIIYNTTEEKEFVEKKFQNDKIPSIVAGVGVEIPDVSLLINAKEKFGLDQYIVYVGRIDESKGCKTLFNYFIEYKKRNPSFLKLALLGKPVMDIPKTQDIISLGFVNEEDKIVVMRDSFALVLASEFESLSMVVLESMALHRPVLVNGKCKVLKGHCTKSNAGLYFTNYFEFEYTLNYLLSHPAEYEAMQENAVKYVRENYRWDKIIQNISALIELVASNI